MHKRFAAFAVPLLYLACASAQADTIRYGSALVSVDDRAFEIRQKRDDPDYRDDVGYTLGSYDHWESKVEEWMYSPRNGMTYILTFEAGELKRIEFEC